MEIVFGGLKNLLSLFASWLNVLGGIPFGGAFWGQIALLTAAFSLCLFSGLFAAQIAERRGFAPHLHLFLGFFLPGIYLLVLPLILKPETGSEVQLEQARWKARKEESAAKAQAEKEALMEKQAELVREEADPGYWPRDRVDRIRLRPDGSAAGPFVMCLKDGRKFSVRRITGTTPECAILELIGNGGQTSSLRVPLSQIDAVRPAEEP